MLKLFLASLLPSLIALPLLVFCGDDAPPAVDDAADAPTLMAMAPLTTISIATLPILP